MFIGMLGPDQRAKLILSGGLIIVFALGLFWFIWSTQVTPSVLDHLVGRVSVIEGTIVEEPIYRQQSQSFVLAIKPDGGKLLVTTRPIPEYRYGDYLKVLGLIEPPENFRPDFDYPAYLAKDDIFYTALFPLSLIHI